MAVLVVTTLVAELDELWPGPPVLVLVLVLVADEEPT